MSAAFTPGPWQAIKYGYERHAVVDARGTEIGFAPRNKDARLIAKAPEMARLIADIEESLTADNTYHLLREACRKLLREIEA